MWFGSPEKFTAHLQEIGCLLSFSSASEDGKNAPASKDQEALDKFKRAYSVGPEENMYSEVGMGLCREFTDTHTSHKENTMRVTAAILLLLIATGAFAQESVIELLRHDIRAEKAAIMSESLPMTEKEAEAFWPLYRDYDVALMKLGDRRIAVMKKIASDKGQMDAETAQQLVKESFKIAGDKNGLLKKYYDKIAKAIGPVKATRFLQIENQLLTLLEAEMIDQIPLVKSKPAQETKK